jgi:hypothetical protein
MEVHRQSMSQELTPTGGGSSGEEVKTLLTSTTRRLLMSIKRRILKDKRLLFTEDTMAGIRDGELSILTNQPRRELLVWTMNMDSISIDHSSSDPDFQCRESLNLFHGMQDLEDTIKEEESNKPGDSTEYRTPSKT